MRELVGEPIAERTGELPQLEESQINHQSSFQKLVSNKFRCNSRLAGTATTKSGSLLIAINRETQFQIQISFNFLEYL